MTRSEYPMWQRLIMRFSNFFERDWFTGRPDLDPGESILERAFLGRRSRWAAQGGTLLLTSKRILFLPNKAERMLGRRAWQCPRSLVIAIEPQDTGINPYRGSLGQGFKVVTVGNADQIFLAYDGLEIMNRFREALR